MSNTPRGEKEAYDQRILADGDFVDMILSESGDITKENLRLVSDRKIDLTRLAERVCKIHGVSKEIPLMDYASSARLSLIM